MNPGYEAQIKAAGFESFKRLVPYLDDDHRQTLIDNNRTVTYAAFIEGVHWAIQHPPPHVRDLVEALKAIMGHQAMMLTGPINLSTTHKIANMALENYERAVK